MVCVCMCVCVAPSVYDVGFFGNLSLCRFFTAAVWCVPALRVPLVHSLINHFRQNDTRCVTARSLRAGRG